ncbi:hypothetical protein H6P81_020574 [Aristolochia fimbriata]|uniref:Glycosyltransferase n=1 Tax=Aristolochia fimbriata TaxID=158543 RepID=A0AAV7DWN8_ARIFI|nr:hypothetical protein H6P81_020574 [Aristolochia fimbriata]
MGSPFSPRAVLPHDLEKMENTDMAKESRKLHIFFIPFMAQGHMIPMIDTAKLFAARGVKASVILTPHNASVFAHAIERAGSSAGGRGSSSTIQILALELPPEFRLPRGIQNLDESRSESESGEFMRASTELEEPFRRLVERHRPDCVVSDYFFPWTADVAGSFSVPRLVFNGLSFFSLCVDDSLRRLQPHATATADDAPFNVPELPDRIELTKAQLPDALKYRTAFTELFERVHVAETKSHGLVMNSFYELERKYVDHFRNKMGKKAWHLGPVSLCNKDMSSVDMAERGMKSSIDCNDCLSWLDAQKPGSVLYLCFGSFCHFTPSQLVEIATALESGDCSFIWVLKNGTTLPDDFVDRTEGIKGLIIRGWAPQMMILNHPAVGGFVTHCGWNSILEGISAGVPMITWPVFAEQFYNEKLVTEVLGVGVGVGNRSWVSWESENSDVIGREKIENVMRSVMGDGETAERVKGKVQELREQGKKATDVGGSSYDDLSCLLKELESLCC